MRILGIIGSHRRKGNTSHLVHAVLESARDAFAADSPAPPELEVLFLRDYRIDACTGCEGCAGSFECVIRDDYPRLVEAIDGADGVVLGSPTYWYSVTSDMKRFIDRSYSLIDYPKNRHEWISKYTGTGKKCVTVAVCEQDQEEMMGNTSELLTSFSTDIGLSVVSVVKALGFFEAGAVTGSASDMDLARDAGISLSEALLETDSE